MKNIAILFIGLGKYSLFYDRFYKSIQKNFLPSHRKHYFIFSDESFTQLKQEETFTLTDSYDEPRDIKLHKFHFIKSAWDQIKSYDYIFYFDADNIVRSKIQLEDIIDDNKPLVGVVHPWGSIRESKGKFESDPNSGAFIEEDKITIPYHQSCFWGGKPKEIENMVFSCYETLDKDIKSGHKNENSICDEVHVNKYFALNSEKLHSLNGDYANPAEAYQSERRLKKKAFGNNILISHDNANQTYKHSLGMLEEQKEKQNNFSFAGWSQVKDNTKATFEMLKMFKAANPNAHVHITNSGERDYSKIAEAFNCSINNDTSIKGWESGNRIVKYNIWDWLQNLKEVCSLYLAPFDWIVILEDDVESFLPPVKPPDGLALAGPNGPGFPREVYNLAKEKFPDEELSKRYTGCGGSIFNRQAFLDAMKDISKKDWDSYCEAYDGLEKYADLSLSFIFINAGMPIGQWDEFCGWTDHFKQNKAFAHGNKQHYGLDLLEQDHEYLEYINYSQIFINKYAHTKNEHSSFLPIEDPIKVEGHSFLKYLINETGTCIDVGCRDFNFSKEVGQLCSRVIAVDPGQNIEKPEINNIIFLNQSLTSSDAPYSYLVQYGRLSNYYTSFENVGGDCVKVPNISLEGLMKTFQLESVDLIKIDSNGSEYGLLYWLAENPVVSQISVSFNDDLGRNPYPNPEAYYHGLFNKLQHSYHIVKHAPNHIGNDKVNYRDSLFVRK